MNGDHPVVRTSALTAVYPTGDGVGPVDLTVGPGEYVLVLGPSGSGKSTVLRMLHGAVPQAVQAEVTGAVWIAGRRVADTGVADLADVVGVLAQDPESGVCLPDVADEVAFPLENLAVDPAAIGRAVDAALARAGADRLRDHRTEELSGGELQRVALAAAIAARPGLLLLDEPTSMLDADGIDAVRQAIDSVRRSTGAACIVVEHRLDELAGDHESGDHESGDHESGDHESGDHDRGGLPERWIVLGRDGRVRHDGPAGELTTGELRELVGQGCWLPIDLELRALLGPVRDDQDRGLDHPAVVEALLRLVGDHPQTPLPRAESGEPPSALPFDRLRERSGVGPEESSDGWVGEGPGIGSSAGIGARSGSPLDRLRERLSGGSAEERADDRLRTSSGESLRARAVVVRRGSRTRRRVVLAGLDLELRPGETVALVGANGSGKSTLLTCLAGLQRPDAGVVSGPRPGLVFQHPEHQFAAATVRAELAHGLPESAAPRVAAMLDRFGLTGVADHNPYRLSGGQQRRLSLAAMLLHDRPFLLADEPGFGLDRQATITALQTLRDTARSGRGVLFSSHDLRAVAGYADRVLVLGGGRLFADTTPLCLLRDPTLLAAARLRPLRLLRRLAERVSDDAALRTILQRLDELALESAPLSSPTGDPGGALGLSGGAASEAP